MIARPLRVASVLALGAVALMMSGCGSDPGQEGSPADPSDGTTASAPSESTSGLPVLQVRDDLVDPYEVPVSSWEVLGDGTLELSVSAGPADCYGASVQPVETTRAVTIAVRVGRLPETVDRECAAVAVASLVRVSLDEPLGDREVVVNPS